MKRNKKLAKGMRSGVSPYKKHGKRPCQHCQQLTADNRRAATQGDRHDIG